MTDPYGGSDALAYDGLNRLTQVTRSIDGVEEHVESYSYNALGALHTSFDPVAMTPVTFNDQRPLVSGGGTGPAAVPAATPDGQTVTLDAGGRITNLQGVAFSYDWRNRVVGIQYTSGANTISEGYGYDPYMRRVERTHTETSPATSSSQYYVFDGPDQVATTDSSNNVLDMYMFDGVDNPLRIRRAGNSTFYEIDLAGNVRRLRDANGADQGGYRYTAFGIGFPSDITTPAAGIEQEIRWKGRWYEPVGGGAYDIRARWWNPVLATFMSVDQYDYHDPGSDLWGWPVENPVAIRDTTGHQGWEEAAGIYALWEASAVISAGVAETISYVCQPYREPAPKPQRDCSAELSANLLACQTLTGYARLICRNKALDAYFACVNEGGNP
jgi:RHS repeat-associated protein